MSKIQFEMERDKFLHLKWLEPKTYQIIKDCVVEEATKAQPEIKIATVQPYESLEDIVDAVMEEQEEESELLSEEPAKDSAADFVSVIEPHRIFKEALKQKIPLIVMVDELSSAALQLISFSLDYRWWATPHHEIRHLKEKCLIFEDGRIFYTQITPDRRNNICEEYPEYRPEAEIIRYYKGYKGPTLVGN